MRVTSSQPQMTVTDWPSVREMVMVVLRPKGAAIIAKDLHTTTSLSTHMHTQKKQRYGRGCLQS